MVCELRVIVMKEIDLLPEWYKSSRRRQIGYRSQYVALGCVLVVMTVWNFVATGSVSKTEAELTQAESKASAVENISLEVGKVKSEMTMLQKRAGILEETDSKIDVANVLAELSFLIDKKVVLSKLVLTSESLAPPVAQGHTNSQLKTQNHVGDVRFKIVMSGVAANAGKVAELTCKLEDSPYFRQVYPSFSRNTRVKAGNSFSGENFQISEFEISCYLANYKEN